MSTEVEPLLALSHPPYTELPGLHQYFNTPALLALNRCRLSITQLCYNSTHFIERNDERRALGPQKVEAFDRLRLQAVHQIHHKDGDVAEGASPRAEVRERFVTGGVDHKHPRQLDVHLHRLVQLGHLDRFSTIDFR